MNQIFKYTFAALGALLAYLEPIGWLVFVCVIAVFIDAFTAYQLSARVKSKHPKLADGKFKSRNAMRSFKSIRDVFMIILLAFLVDDKILIMGNFYLPYIVSGAFCFVQIWSILENISSCNDAPWASILQNVMVDKTARHFEIDPKLITSTLEQNEKDNPVVAGMPADDIVQTVQTVNAGSGTN